MNDRYTEVLQQYELEVFEVRRGRGAWICETSQGLKLLKEYRGTEKRVQFEEEVLEAIKGQGGLYTDRYVKNREEQLISTAGDGTRYILKDWFEDRECNLKEEQEVMKAVSKIAVLHKLLRTIEFREEWNLGSILAQPLAQEMERHNKELKRARTYIRSKRKKSDFELCVIGNFELFYQQAQEALEGLSLLEESGSHQDLFLCHGDLDQHHILIGNRSVAVIEYNRMHLGKQMADLYHFMRKVMEKQDWNMKLGMSMLESYDKILPLSKADRICLYYLFLYPEKYWKQINFYYNANKAWIPARNIEKLQNLESQLEGRDRFLSKIK